MTEPSSCPGLEDEDKLLIEAIWSETDSSLNALIKAGHLDPKVDFVREDLRGWPLAGQDVRGIDFTGSDLRGSGIEDAIRDKTTILTDAILDEVQLSKIKLPKGAKRGLPVAQKGWSTHWHAGVHQEFGNDLYLVLLSFITGSIFVKDSITRNLKESGVTDYMIFNLYSQWDIAIRLWANEKTFAAVQATFEANGEIDRIHKDKHYFKIHEIYHYPDNAEIYPSVAMVKSLLTNIPTEKLKDVQNKGHDSQSFSEFRNQGLILENETRFANRRIQFYIFISARPSAPQRFNEELLGIVSRSREIKSKSVYFTSREAVLAVVKGQVAPAQFYDVYAFLRRMTEQLQRSLRVHIETETMLVANQYHDHTAMIDFNNPRVRTSKLWDSTENIIAGGENERAEFKSTLRTNLTTGKDDPRMEHEVLKTVAAFLNTNGGTLIIGISDSKEPLGLAADRFSEDKMNLHLVNLIKGRMGAHHMMFVKLRFDDYRGKRVFVIECSRGASPVYVRDNNKEQFYFRTGAATTELSGSNLQQFLNDRFRAR